MMLNFITPPWFGNSRGKDITFMELKPEGTECLLSNILVCRKVTVTSTLENMRKAEVWLTYIGLSSSKGLFVGQKKT